MTILRALSRRTALAGAGALGTAAALAGCGSSDDESSSDASASASTGTAATTAAASATAAATGATTGTATGTALGSTSDIPVGGGTIYSGKKVVVTQPTAGTYHGFSAVCTHQGCTVGKVSGGQIICTCHNSHFSATDGSPISGPAQTALASENISVQNGTVYLT